MRYPAKAAEKTSGLTGIGIMLQAFVNPARVNMLRRIKTANIVERVSAFQLEHKSSAKIMDGNCREPDGSIKSRSVEKETFFGNKYTESTGGSSQTKHKTQNAETWTGKKYRKTE
jgi:hypothetical protein